MRNNRQRLGLRLALAAAAMSAAAIACSPATARAAASGRNLLPPTGHLPTPYSQWDVELTPSTTNDHVVTLTFNSPLLGERVVNTVYLPDEYSVSGARFPVIYVLHGTVFPYLDNCALKPVTQVDTLLQITGCAGGYLQDELYGITSQLQNMHFLAVAPDTGPTQSFCETCAWINGSGDQGLHVRGVTAYEAPADSFLHDELYPLVQTLFNVRTDRGGRGVIGFSMGGWSAALQGMLHPDDYSYVGMTSGIYDIFEPGAEQILEAVGYLRDQGYGPLGEGQPVWYQQYDPMDIASNLRGTDTKFFLSSGDGCISLADLTAPGCQGPFSPIRNAGGAPVEEILSSQRRIAAADLSAKGIPYTTVQTPGTHGANNAITFAQDIVPEANAQFAAHVPPPATFSYTSVMPAFEIWGYTFAVKRDAPDFLALTAVRTDGRRLTLTGVGEVTITMPPRFHPDRTYLVTGTSVGSSVTEDVTARADGRLRVTVDLGQTAAQTMQITVAGSGPRHVPG